MMTFFVVLAVMLGFVALMGIGVWLGRKPISGSCGGMSALGMDTACDICGGDRSRCEEVSAEADASQAEQADASLAYDAGQSSRENRSQNG